MGDLRPGGAAGSGDPRRARSGGSDPAKLPDALQLARKLVAEKLGA